MTRLLHEAWAAVRQHAAVTVALAAFGVALYAVGFIAGRAVIDALMAAR